MVLIKFFEKSWTIVHGFDRFFDKKRGLFMVLIDFLIKSVDYKFMVLIDFLKKSWTIVHGFDRYFEKSWFMVLIDFLMKIMDYSLWFSSIF